MSINDKDFNNTVESAPTEIVSISNIDEDIDTGFYNVKVIASNQFNCISEE